MKTGVALIDTEDRWRGNPPVATLDYANLEETPAAGNPKWLAIYDAAAERHGRVDRSLFLGEVRADEHGADASGVAAASGPIAEAAAKAAGLGVPLRVPPGTYKIDQLALPAGLTMLAHGAHFRMDGSLSGSAVGLTVGAGALVDHLKVTSPGTDSNDTYVSVADGAQLGVLDVRADVQRFSCKGVVTNGQDVRMAYCNVEGIAQGLTINNDDLGVRTGLDIDFLRVRGFVTGARIKSQENWRIGGYDIRNPRAAFGQALYEPISASGAAIAFDGDITSGTAALHCPGIDWTGATVGDTVRVVAGGPGGGDLITTLAAIADADDVTLADNVSATFAGDAIVMVYGYDAINGNNGILLAGGTNGVLGDGVVEGSGEHAIRFSYGVAGGQVEVLKMGRLMAIKPGACALKLNADIGGGVGRSENLDIAGVHGIDIGRGILGVGKTPSLFEASHLHSVRLGYAHAIAEDFAWSGVNGVIMQDIRDMQIGDLYCQAIKSRFLFFDKDANANPDDVHDVTIRHMGGTIVDAGNDAIVINMDGFTVGNIYLPDCTLNGFTEKLIRMDGGAIPSGDIFDMRGRTNGAVPIDLDLSGTTTASRLRFHILMSEGDTTYSRNVSFPASAIENNSDDVPGANVKEALDALYSETGNSGNGYWFRTASGMQRCWHFKNVVQVGTKNYIEFVWTFPKVFTSAASVVPLFHVGQSNDLTGITNVTPLSLKVWGKTATTATFRVYSTTVDIANGDTLDFYVSAEGNWS